MTHQGEAPAFNEADGSLEFERFKHLSALFRRNGAEQANLVSFLPTLSETTVELLLRDSSDGPGFITLPADQQEEVLSDRRDRMLQQLNQERQERLPELSQHFTQTEIATLRHMHLQDKDSATQLGLGKGGVGARIRRAQARVGLKTREELAVWAFERGLEYDVSTPPPMTSFTIRERLIAARLTKPNADIINDLEITKKQLNTSLGSLYQKTGAVTRSGLAIIAQLHGFKPFPEELQDDTPEALQVFTEFQQAAVQLMHLPVPAIAEQLALSESQVNGALERALVVSDAANRVSLALQLHAGGLNFDINPPKRPLHEILTKKELDIAQALHLSNTEIAEKLGEGLTQDKVGALVGYINAKTGARTRTELALMTELLNTGQSKPAYHNVLPREERFFKAIGVDDMSMDEARHLLKHATPRQAEYIEAYYFSAEQLSWRAIGRQFEVRKEAAIIMATRGLARIRQQLKTQNHLNAQESNGV